MNNYKMSENEKIMATALVEDMVAHGYHLMQYKTWNGGRRPMIALWALNKRPQADQKVNMDFTQKGIDNHSGLCYNSIIKEREETNNDY